MKRITLLSMLTASLLSFSYADTIENPAEIMKTALEKMEAVVNETSTSQKKITSTDAFDYKLHATQVSDNTWCFLGALEGPSKENAGNMVNTCYIQTKDSFIVIDTGPSYQYAKQAYEVMKKIQNLPVKVVINSHEHDDHWLGNNFYKARFQANIIGPTLINQYKDGDKTRMFNTLPQNAIEGTKIIPVDESPKETLTLTIGEEKFEIIPMNIQAHTMEDFFVYMPERKILFAGDLVMNGRITSNRHGSLLGQLKALEKIKALEWDILVPGHGLNVGKDAMNEAEQYFTLLHERILKALEDDVDASEISKVIPMDEFKDKAMFQALNGQNVEEAFSEIEFAED
jgi:glyoxylase-like metal-dependent hydrolase (beta-lactamase superfamily II)